MSVGDGWRHVQLETMVETCASSNKKEPTFYHGLIVFKLLKLVEDKAKPKVPVEVDDADACCS